MNIITPFAAEFKTIPTATNKKHDTAFTESIPEENVSSRSGEENQPPEGGTNSDATMHCLSRSVARQHGIIPSAILTGFAYKLKHHKRNQWNGRWWYYDSIETLRTQRWSYLSDGCICQTTKYLQERNLLTKGCNNKLSYDRTSWYAMNDDIREMALSDLVWFDLGVTKKLKSIPCGLIYHNLRYHLREMVKENAGCEVPYHKLNKAMLARLLPMSESTVKRCVEDLIEAKLILRHATKRNLFTIADQSEYRQISSSVNANGSSVNANRSSVNGSTVNANRSSVNENRSNVNANRSSVNDYTQYETNLNPVRNHSQIAACVSSNTSSSVTANTIDDKLDHSSFVDQKIISDIVGSTPLRAQEGTEAVSASSFRIPATFAQLLHHAKASEELLQSLDEGKRSMYLDEIFAICKYFIEEHLDAKLIHEFWGNHNPDVVLTNVNKLFAEYIHKEIPGRHELTPDKLWQLLYYPGLEMLVLAFPDPDSPSKNLLPHSMASLNGNVSDARWALRCKMNAESMFSPEIKVELFKRMVILHNKHGWLLRDDSQRINAVQPISAAFKKIKEVFALNPHITVDQLFWVLDMCVDTHCMTKEPMYGKRDPFWHVRKATNLDTFVMWLEKIISELGLFDECPIHEFPTFERQNVG